MLDEVFFTCDTSAGRRPYERLTQDNTSANDVSANIRFNVIYRPGSDLYPVSNDQVQTGLPADIFGRKDRQLVMTLTYLLQR